MERLRGEHVTLLALVVADNLDARAVGDLEVTSAKPTH